MSQTRRFFLVLICLVCFACADCKGGRGRGRGSGPRRGGSSNWSFTNNNNIRAKPQLSYWQILAKRRENNFNKLYNHPDRSTVVARQYGTTFGIKGISRNTYIANKYYKNPKQPGESFLANALFFQAGMNHGRRSWTSDDDKRWRATTKAPYFENKVPGSESFLPAAAVIGAATAFGLATLLPLNVPANKALMYCNSTEIIQAHIKLEGAIYSCVNGSIAMSCPNAFDNSTIDECLNRTMECDQEEPDELQDLFCTNGTLVTKFNIACNSTISSNKTNESTPILDCFFGSFHTKLSSSIPTTTTEAPIVVTTEKQFSLESKIHMFLLDLIGQSEVYGTTTAPSLKTEDSQPNLKKGEEPWAAEALTLPPGFEVPDEEYPFSLVYREKSKMSNGTEYVDHHYVDPSLEKNWLKLHLEYGVALPEFVSMIPKELKEAVTTPGQEVETSTTSNVSDVSSESETTTSGQSYYEWMAAKQLKSICKLRNSLQKETEIC